MEARQRHQGGSLMTNSRLTLPVLLRCETPAPNPHHAWRPVCKSSQLNTCPQCNLTACSKFYFLPLKEIEQNIGNTQMFGLQILAFVAGLVGLGTTIVATVSNEWGATSRASSVITATWILKGLWYNCAGNAIGALHCRPHHTILKLEGKPSSHGSLGLMSDLTGVMLSQRTQNVTDPMKWQKHQRHV